MKILFFAAITCAIFSSCNNASESAAAAKDTTAVKATAKEAPAEAISLPYTAEYSTKFSPGNPANTKLVLDLYKLFETNKLSDARSILTDTMSVDFSDGTNFKGSADSLISMGNKYRAMMTDYKYKFDTWMSIHSDDKNEDWVLIWSTAYSTNKAGKKDSVRIHEYYQIKDNKIAYWSEFNQKFPAPPKKKK